MGATCSLTFSNDIYTGYIGKEMDIMLIIMFLAFLLCYVICWKKEIKEFQQEKQAKTLKEIRKTFDIDIR